MPTRRTSFWLLFAVIASLTWLAYHRGLSGGYLFDDYANLPALGAGGPIDDIPTLLRYLTSGTADPTGRPLSLLSFLFDAHDWPAAPYAFKRTNLLIHLLNGALLAVLLRALGRFTVAGRGENRCWRIDVAAAVGAGLWMLHPLFVSTTLYIVQREAMLPATFTVLGLLSWLHGRQRIVAGKSAQGVAWVIGGLGLCTALAMLSKANGILLPAFALAIEYAFLRPIENAQGRQPPGKTYQRAWWLFAWLPASLLGIYLLRSGYTGIRFGISHARPWTLAQRLMTEPRVLMDYLDLLWLPRPFTPGLFNDQIAPSTSLLHPWTTLPCIVATLALITAGWRIRHRWPAVSLAIMFFFVGQSLESSTIALELFFEHRNYLPAMLMFWPLALWLCNAMPQTTRSCPPPRTNVEGETTPQPKTVQATSLALMIIAVLGLAAMTWARADLWGNSRDQALMWARLNPASARAQANAAQAMTRTGRPDLAMRKLKPALAAAPDEVQLALNLLAAQCRSGSLDDRTLAAARKSLETTRDTGTLLASWFGRAIGQSRHPDCPQLDLDLIEDLIHAALRNPVLTANAGRQQDLHYLLGRVALARGDGNQALDQFDQALSKQPRPGAALEQAAMLGSAGFPSQGLAHLAYYRSLPPARAKTRWNMARVHDWVLQKQHYWDNEMARLEATLRDDLRKNS